MFKTIIKIYVVIFLGVSFMRCHDKKQDASLKGYTGIIEFTTPINTYGKHISLNDQTVLIEKGGTYKISGNSENGQIIVNANNEEVVLELDNVELVCTNNSPIMIESAKKVIITTLKDTNNILKDTKNSKTSAVIYSQSDLVLKGEGILKVDANNKNGIETTQNMQVVSGEYQIKANQSGIIAQDLILQNATYKIQSNEASFFSKQISSLKGVFLLETSTVALKANTINLNQGEWTIESKESGFIASLSLHIKEGTYLFQTKKQCIEANEFVIYDGSFILNSDEIGILAKDHMAVYDGDLTIENSQTGIQTYLLEVNGGTTNIISRNDGISILNQENNLGKFTFQNGNMMIDAGSVALNIEGNMSMLGGTMYINGPINTYSEAIQCSTPYTIENGILCVLDKKGTTQILSNNSTQPLIMMKLGATVDKGTSIVVKDQHNFNIFEYTSLKPFQSMMISTNKFSLQDTYSIYINNEFYGAVTLNQLYTIIQY